MKDELKQKAILLGKLIAHSSIPNGLKKGIIESLTEFTEGDVDELIRIFEREQVELERLENILKDFEKKRDADWKMLEDRQRRIADEYVSDILEEIDKKAAEVVKGKM